MALENLQLATKDPGLAAPGADDCFEVYQRELDYLVGSLRRLGVPYADLEDVVHEVFLVILRRWDDYDRTRPVKPWLFGIAFRVAASQRRKSTRELPAESSDTEDLGLKPDEAALAGETRSQLLKALGRVPLERRAVLIMHDVDELGMREIAAQLSIPLFTAYSRLRKARKELEGALARLEKGGRHDR